MAVMAVPSLDLGFMSSTGSRGGAALSPYTSSAADDEAGRRLIAELMQGSSSEAAAPTAAPPPSAVVAAVGRRVQAAVELRRPVGDTGSWGGPSFSSAEVAEFTAALMHESPPTAAEEAAAVRLLEGAGGSAGVGSLGGLGGFPPEQREPREPRELPFWAAAPVITQQLVERYLGEMMAESLPGERVAFPELSDLWGGSGLGGGSGTQRDLLGPSPSTEFDEEEVNQFTDRLAAEPSLDWPSKVAAAEELGLPHPGPEPTAPGRWAGADDDPIGVLLGADVQHGQHELGWEDVITGAPQAPPAPSTPRTSTPKQPRSTHWNDPTKVIVCVCVFFAAGEMDAAPVPRAWKARNLAQLLGKQSALLELLDIPLRPDMAQFPPKAGAAPLQPPAAPAHGVPDKFGHTLHVLAVDAADAMEGTPAQRPPKLIVGDWLRVELAARPGFGHGGYWELSQFSSSFFRLRDRMEWVAPLGRPGQSGSGGPEPSAADILAGRAPAGQAAVLVATGATGVTEVVLVYRRGPAAKRVVIELKVSPATSSNAWDARLPPASRWPTVGELPPDLEDQAAKAAEEAARRPAEAALRGLAVVLREYEVNRAEDSPPPPLQYDEDGNYVPQERPQKPTAVYLNELHTIVRRMTRTHLGSGTQLQLSRICLGEEGTAAEAVDGDGYSLRAATVVRAVMQECGMDTPLGYTKWLGGRRQRGGPSGRGGAAAGAAGRGAGAGAAGEGGWGAC